MKTPTPKQMDILKTLYEMGGWMGPKAIGMQHDRYDSASSWARDGLVRLIEQGLVCKHPRRIYNAYSLTEQGKAFCKEVFG